VFVEAHGGTVYARVHRYRCCSTSSLAPLDIEIAPPKGVAGYISTDSNELDLKYCDGRRRGPNQLIIELRGILRRHFVPYGGGSEFKIWQGDAPRD